MSCGIDEAGRGPVIGPMVIAGICASRRILLELGVKDSKRLSSKRREHLAEEIRKVADKIVVRVVEPEEIDGMRMSMTMNKMEALLFAQVIEELQCGEIYVDAADVDEERFSSEIGKHLKRDVKIISKHRADSIYPEVSAASIIAKVERDRRIKKIAKKIGDFGSGYPSDPRTIEFLVNYYRKNGKLPPYVRRSWATVRKIIAKTTQNSLDSY